VEHQELLVAIGAIIGALMSGIQVIGKWREEHRTEVKTNKRLAQAQKKVSFLETWRNSQAAVNSSARQEKVDRYIADELDDIFIATLYPPESGSSLAFPSRRWFLMFMPRSFWGWMSRLGFFMFFPIFMMFIPFCISDVIYALNYEEPTKPLSLKPDQEIASTEDHAKENIVPPKPFSQMTVNEYAQFFHEQQEKNGTADSGVLTITDENGPIPMAEANKKREPNLEGALGAISFIGTICLCCYLVSVRDGKYLVVENKKPERELPGFLIQAEEEPAEPVFLDDETNPYAA